MAANKNPIYGYSPQTRSVLIKNANTSRDGTGVLYTGFIADIYGSRLDRITIQCAYGPNINAGGVPSNTIIRIFITDNTGNNPRIYKELVPGQANVAANNNSPNIHFNIYGGLLLQPGQIVQCSLSVTDNAPWNVVFEGVDFASSVSGPIYKRTITIDKNSCGSANSSNFPVLVSLVNNNLKTVANGGKVQNINGYDIQFFSDSTFTTKLNWEIDVYNGTTGSFVAWVKLPTVSFSSYTQFYMSYGDSTITTFQGGSSGVVWDSNYKAVYHFGDGSVLNTNDYTTNGQNGTAFNGVSATSGFFPGSGGASFNTNQYIETNYILNASSFTMSAWVKTNTSGTTNRVIGNEDSVNGLSGADIIYGYTTTQTRSLIRKGGVSYDIFITTPVPIANLWSYVVLTFNTTVGANLYWFDATDVYINYTGTTANTDLNPITSTLTTRIGRDGNGTDAFNGTIDEVRISNIARSSSWIITEYNNGMLPGNFNYQGLVPFLTYSSEY
jgi:Concanavalin A-like lectin/glucanases superfamily/Domain of unknown function (DUF2341)